MEKNKLKSLVKELYRSFLLSGVVLYTKQRLFLWISIVLAVSLLSMNLFRIGPRLLKGLEVFSPTNDLTLFSNELKLRQRIGPEVYDYYEFVKNNTPEDARILIPPQGLPWPRIGNSAYSRYFLYPRYLVSGKEKEPGIDLKKENMQYVMVSWGEVNLFQYGYTHGWPKFGIPAKMIIWERYSQRTQKHDIDISYKDFSPSDLNPDWWGLIKVDLERL